MTLLAEGQDAPDFCLPAVDDKEVCLSKLKGKWIVLYFYPKDNTKGCTMEALEFTAAEDEFNQNGAIILGVSPDDIKSHVKFKEKHDLGLNLLSDIEKDVLEKYGVWQKKKMFGKEYMGVVRSTFLIDPDGKIRHVWRKVKVKGHVDKVMQKLITLRAN
ncbi:MAG: thioredoxin-dependent thiol peroxidase [Promethearchaeota archaeon]|jgi:peroxiredoxin Q/BCP